MKLLINDKEIVQFFIETIDHKDAILNLHFNQPNIENAIAEIQEDLAKKDFNLEKKRAKIKHKIEKAVVQDLKDFVVFAENTLEERKKLYENLIKKNYPKIIEKFNFDDILKCYQRSKFQNFVKTVGNALDSSAPMVRRHYFKNYQEDCLFRNMDGNEELLLTKMNNNYPFWFIDTGYTNFLNGKKKNWHRLTRNHLHHFKEFEAPVDRLGIFEFFPRQWRTSGEKILIIEPGNFSAKTFKIDINQWKKDVERELREYTDKPIVFREKLSKKVRKSLYKELMDEDYYCVINSNSNAAIESLWAGIPVITLDKHISNPVSRNKISDINNLFRGNLATWLSMLSYSQFTFEELMNGTAVNIVKKYHV